MPRRLKATSLASGFREVINWHDRMSQFETDRRHMRRAIQLASHGQGHVEPNPMVGCVIARSGTVISEGWHQKYGGPHAEVEALRGANQNSVGATMYVTLEPCCHHGKTPPCTDQIIKAQIGRVVVAQTDPFSAMQGRGIQQLQTAGIHVDVGLGKDEVSILQAPYFKLIKAGRPWMLAKWAMTIDGKIASRTGSSQWISSEESREIVHHLRGRVDAILVGRLTVQRDNPMLTARPSGARTATRVVVDSHATISLESQLVQSADMAPVLVSVGPGVDEGNCRRLATAGCEILRGDSESWNERLGELLDEFGRRRWTNVLVEGGGHLLGTLFDLGEIDEIHTFIAPKLIGGACAIGPVLGSGIAEMGLAARIQNPQVEQIGPDIYVHGLIRR